MPAVARSRPFESDRHIEFAACRDEGLGIAGPTLIVEIQGQEVASVIEEQRIYAGDEIAASAWANAVLAAEMAFNHVGGYGDECLVRALTASDLRLAANAAYPLVGACWSIARAAGLGVFPPDGEDIGPTCKEAAEKRNFVRRWGGIGDWGCRQSHCSWLGLRSFELMKPSLQSPTFGLQLLQT
jgi:hypothetical protein